MTENTPKGLILLIIGLIAAYLIARIQESKSLRALAEKWSALNMRSRLGLLALLILVVAYAGSKPTNTRYMGHFTVHPFDRLARKGRKNGVFPIPS